MLREQDELTSVAQVPVNEAEYAKFCYLVKAIDAVDRAHSLAKKHAQELKSKEGIRAFMKFDWRPVIQFVQPQLQVVFLQDGQRNLVEQNFMEFPYAAIVVRNAWIVELDSVFELNLEATDSHQGVKEVTNAFRSLEATIGALEGKRALDGMRILNQLKRVLKPEL